MVLTVGVAGWLLADVLWALNPRGLASRVSAVAFYVSISVTLAGWAAFTLEFGGYRSSISRLVWGLLAVAPLYALVLVWTNPMHHLWFRGNIALSDGGGLAPGYWVHHVYTYALVVGGILLLLWTLYNRQTLYRGQIYVALLGVCLPWFADIVYELELVAIELHGIALVGACLLLSLSVFRHKFLRHSPTAQRPLLENLRDGVVVIDRDGQVTSLNDAAIAVLGADVTGRNARSVWEAQLAFEPHADTMLSAEAEETFEVELDDRYYDVQVTPLFDHRDVLIARQVQLHDITAQRQRELELERQNERLDRLASVVSHDLRNPLNVAKLNADLTLQTGEPEHVEEVADALDRMETLVDDLLTLAREGQTVEETEPVRLGECADRAWEFVDTDAATLAVADDCSLEADPDRLRQALENLFRNAVEHGSEQVTVTVGVLADGPGFYVADDGPGIPEADRDSVFDRGFSKSSDGTGFGLAIVADIAEAHGWTVDVTESQSGGARFEFRTGETAVTPDHKAVSEG